MARYATVWGGVGGTWDWGGEHRDIVTHGVEVILITMYTFSQFRTNSKIEPDSSRDLHLTDSSWRYARTAPMSVQRKYQINGIVSALYLHRLLSPLRFFSFTQGFEEVGRGVENNRGLHARVWDNNNLLLHSVGQYVWLLRFFEG